MFVYNVIGALLGAMLALVVMTHSHVEKVDGLELIQCTNSNSHCFEFNNTTYILK